MSNPKESNFDPSRRANLTALLGVLGGSIGITALAGCDSDEIATIEPGSLGTSGQPLNGTTIRWVDTVLGAAPPAAPIGDLATSNSSALGGAVVVIAKGCITPLDGGGGVFVWEDNIATGHDGGTIIVPNPAGRWRRLFNGPLNVKWFGAKGTDSGNDGPAIEAALAAGPSVYLPPTYTYRVTSSITITGNKTLSGGDGGSQAFQHATINHAASTGPLFNVTSDENGGVCIKNLNIIGGNGSFAIVSSRSYVRYEYLHMEPYKGGGIQLLSSGVGSSSSKLINCQWVAPTTPKNNYTGFEINVNGGDVRLQGCTAIYGAIGINIIQGQTIVLDECSVTKQAIAYGYSSAAQYDTCGIKLSGSGYKQAISIRNTYVEACTNGIYVESCESLTIGDNLLDDGGMCGFDGIGNSLIYLKDAACKNVTIQNNRIIGLSNGTVPNPFYPVYFNSASNVLFLNNYLSSVGTNAAGLYVTTSGTVWQLGTTRVYSSQPQPDYDPNGNLKTLDSATPWLSPTLSGAWVNVPSIPVGYMKDSKGMVCLQGAAQNGAIPGTIFNLPVGFRPNEQQSFLVNSNGSVGVVTVFTNGDVVVMSGSNAYVYLNPILFKT